MKAREISATEAAARHLHLHLHLLGLVVDAVLVNRLIYGVLDGFAIEREAFWVKSPRNRWEQVPRETALDEEPIPSYENPALGRYALATFVLRSA